MGVASCVALLQNLVDGVSLHMDRGRIARGATPGAGRQPPSQQRDISRDERKTEADLRKMCIGGEHLPVLMVVTSSCLWLRSPLDCCLEQLMYECLVRLALPRCQLSEFG
jgi:hypothetical protein